jgi:2-phospho-L-lactate transferase/gluconeogenesis factor (CofD/UPF0052 family)
LTQTSAARLLTLNLAPQQGETTGFSPHTYLEVLAGHAPDLWLDVVLADPDSVSDVAGLASIVATFGAELVLERVGVAPGVPRHDPRRLASAYRDIFTRGRIRSCR